MSYTTLEVRLKYYIGYFAGVLLYNLLFDMERRRKGMYNYYGSTSQFGKNKRFFRCVSSRHGNTRRTVAWFYCKIDRIRDVRRGRPCASPADGRRQGIWSPMGEIIYIPYPLHIAIIAVGGRRGYIFKTGV